MPTNFDPVRIGKPAISSGRRRLLGVGAAFPGEAISTPALCQHIQQQFGVQTRRYLQFLASRLDVQQRYLCRDFSSPHEVPRAGARNPELAAGALKNALASAQLSAGSLGYLISHTATPAQLLPGGSAEIARLVGYEGAHVELRQACTGFANALQLAFALTATPDAAPVAIIGVETGSVFFDPTCLREDASQWVNFLQMGDGAAGVIVGPDNGTNASAPGIRCAYFGQIQAPPPSGLTLRTGGSDRPTAHGTLSFEHDFKSVEKHGAMLLDAGRHILHEAGFDIHHASFVVPHQASGAVAAWLAKRWNLPPERVCVHAREVGNLGSASIWAALHDSLQKRPAAQPGSAPILFLGAEATQYSYGGFALEF